MKLMDSTVCFINAHFAANQSEIQKRNDDYNNIFQKLVFVDPSITCLNKLQSANKSSSSTSSNNNKLRDDLNQLQSKIIQMNQELNSNSSSSNGSVKSINNNETFSPTSNSSINNAPVSILEELKNIHVTQHDVIFWVGDLNYRLNDISIDTALTSIKGGTSYELLQYDQLTQEKDMDCIFHHFHEGMITFNPTYKYIPGTDDYDNRPEKKMRVPAWCDRILWRVGNGSELARKAQILKGREELLEWEKRIQLRYQVGDASGESLGASFSPTSFSSFSYNELYNMPMEPVMEMVELMYYKCIHAPNMSDHKPIKGR